MKIISMIAALGCAALCSCSDGSSPAGIDDGGSGDADSDGDSDTDSDSDGDSDSDSDTDSSSETDQSVCGDGVTEGDEVCDDGNQLSGDGCNSSCTMNDQWDVVANALTEGDQRRPALACGGDGVVLAFSDWEEGDPSGAAVMVRLFGADGMPLDNAHGGDQEFSANTGIFGHQHQPRVARLPDGGFFAAWTNASGAVETGDDVRGRLFAADGDSSMADFALSSVEQGEQATPAVAAADDGTLLAVWADDSASGADTSGFGIKGRLFDADGEPLPNAQTLDDGEFQLNQLTAGNQIQPDAAWIGDRFLVVWADASGTLDSDGYGIVGTAIDSEAFFVGPEADTLINTTGAGLQATPRVAHQPGLGAVVVWTDDSRSDDTSHYGVRARLVDGDCAGRHNAISDSTGDFQVNTVIDGGQQAPAVAVLAGGELTFVWQDRSGEDGSGSGVRARQLAASGEPIASQLAPEGDDFQVNTTFLGDQITPAVCATGGWFLAAWEDQSETAPDESGAAVRYRLLPGF
ncbi:MAG: DUF4215 domain-containing protein [Polyangia bacterium]